MGTSVSKDGDGKTNTFGVIASPESDDDDAGGGIRGLHPRTHLQPRSPNQDVFSGSKPIETSDQSLPRDLLTPRIRVSDPLDDAIVDSRLEFGLSPPAEPSSSDSRNFALALDHYLSKGSASPMTSTTPARAQPTPSRLNSARETLKSVGPLTIPAKSSTLGLGAVRKSSSTASTTVVGSAGSLTSDASSLSSTDQVLTPDSELDDFGTRLGSYGESASNSLRLSSPPAKQLDQGSPSGSVSTSETPVGTPEAVRAGESAVKRTLSTAWLNNIIRRVCVAGLEKRRTSKFVLTHEEILLIARASIDSFMSEPVVLELAAPVKVVGDLHGQFKDLMRIFRKCGMPPQTSYLFLGDYVDRGKQSLETLILLLTMKLRYPGHVYLLRGNHECANVTKVYGFYDECKRRLSVKSWKTFVDVFNTLPIAATIAGKIFCVHGGLSPKLKSLADIDRMQRPTDIPDSGLISDLLWSDPDPQVAEWTDSDRGVSYLFGRRPLERFCHQLGFDLVARGHMVVEDGYEFFGNRRLVTIFSAPNYCGDFDNYGAVMSVGQDLVCSFELIEPLSKASKGTSAKSK